MKIIWISTTFSPAKIDSYHVVKKLQHSISNLAIILLIKEQAGTTLKPILSFSGLGWAPLALFCIRGNSESPNFLASMPPFKYMGQTAMAL